MKDPILDLVHQKEESDKTNDILMQHDIAIKQLETRLNSLENLCNKMHNKIPVYWEEIDSE